MLEENEKTPEEVLEYMLSRDLYLEFNPFDEIAYRFRCYSINEDLQRLFSQEQWFLSEYNYLGLLNQGFPVAFALKKVVLDEIAQLDHQRKKEAILPQIVFDVFNNGCQDDFWNLYR